MQTEKSDKYTRMGYMEVILKSNTMFLEAKWQQLS